MQKREEGAERVKKRQRQLFWGHLSLSLTGLERCTETAAGAIKAYSLSLTIMPTVRIYILQLVAGDTVRR